MLILIKTFKRNNSAVTEKSRDELQVVFKKRYYA